MRGSSRYTVFISAVLLALFAAACGGAGTSTGSPTTASSTTTGGSTSGGAASSTNPADTAKGLYTALFTGGDITTYLCTSNAAAAKSLSEGLVAMRDTIASSSATIDVSGMTFDAGTVSGDSAQVKVGGSFKVTHAGTARDIPVSAETITLKNEGGAWKICG